MPAQKALAITIVIPVYNEENHLFQCLQAIESQSVLPDEVIVVDNNSTDDSMSIAKQFAFVQIVKESQQGIVFARNRGFDTASGDLIGRIDADTVLPSDWVENVLDAYSEKSDIVLTGTCHFTNLPFSRYSSRLHDVCYFMFSRLLLGKEALFGSNMVMPREIWEQASKQSCSNNRVHEDTDLSVHLPRDAVVVRSEAIRADTLLRMPRRPDRLLAYVYRWLYTLIHHRFSRTLTFDYEKN